MELPICPKCASSNIAEIVYGYVVINEYVRRELNQRRMVLGGCCTSENDPKWECNNYPNMWD